MTSKSIDQSSISHQAKPSIYSKFGALMLASSLSVCSSSFADDASTFYRGKNIVVAVGAGNVGSYAVYSRLVADHLGRNIPGEPSVVFQAMPGAGGLRATNYAFNVAPKDGTFILLIVQTAAVDQLLKSDQAKFDVRKFQFLGRLNDNTPVSVGWLPAEISSVEILRTKEVPTGGTGPSSPTDILPNLLNRYAGTKFKLISGYKGAGDMQIAMERGETMAMVASLTTFQSSLAHFVRDGKVKILVQLAQKRHRDIPDVPTAADLISTEEGKRVANFFGSSADIGRALVVPPGVPAPRVDLLRKAFVAMLQDEQFLAAAKKLNVGLNPASPEEMEKIVEEALALPPSVVKAAVKIVAGGR